MPESRTSEAVAASPSPALTAADLEDRAIHRRAVQAMIWGMPAVNFQLMRQAAAALGAEWNQVVWWSTLPDWRNQTLTPNPDVIYLLPFFNTKEVGPVVLEIPPADGGSITGTIMDAWQAALEDVGPAGVDKGKGGKYLILPPGFQGEPPAGYIALPCDTHAGYAVLRSNVKSTDAADVAAAADYGRRVRLYPLSQAASPADATFVDAVDETFDSTIPYDRRFFEALDRFVQAEPWLERDKAMIGQLESFGLEQGERFAPDERTAAILDDAAREAHAWLETHYEAAFSRPWCAGARWALPVSQEVIDGQASFFADPRAYPVDGRGVMFSMAFFSPKHLGAGQFYLMTIRDRDGRDLDGAATYRLHVPAAPPVKLYWSATVYDRATHALIRDMPWFSRSSNTPGLQPNGDDSVDIWFGPKPPPGEEANWVPTDAGGRFEVLFRFYGPEKRLFDKSWRLPDLERQAFH